MICLAVWSVSPKRNRNTFWPESSFILYFTCSGCETKSERGMGLFLQISSSKICMASNITGRNRTRAHFVPVQSYEYIQSTLLGVDQADFSPNMWVELKSTHDAAGATCQWNSTYWDVTSLKLNNISVRPHSRDFGLRPLSAYICTEIIMGSKGLRVRDSGENKMDPYHFQPVVDCTSTLRLWPGLSLRAIAPGNQSAVSFMPV